MNTAFFQDPVTFRHRFEELGASSFATFLRTKYLGGKPAHRALSLMCGDGWQDKRFFSEGLFERAFSFDENEDLVQCARDSTTGFPISCHHLAAKDDLGEIGTVPLVYSYGRLGQSRNLDTILSMARQVLEPGGLFAFFGYCGPRSGPTASERRAICQLLSGLPPELVAEPLDIEKVQYLFTDASALTRNGEFVRGTIEDHFHDLHEFDFGGLLTFPAWSLINSRMSYDSDEQIAVPLMLQVIELRLMRHRIIGPGVKLIVAKR